MRSAINVLHAAMAINTKLLNKTIPILLCFGFATNVDPRDWVGYADTEKRNRYSHSSNMIIERGLERNPPRHS